MKAQEQVIRRWIKHGQWQATVAIVAARLAPRVGYWASKQFAIKLGCPVALWRIAYLCEMGHQVEWDEAKAELRAAYLRML